MEHPLKVIILQRNGRRLSSTQQRWISLLLLLAGISLGLNISLFTARRTLDAKQVVALPNAAASSIEVTAEPLELGPSSILPETFLRNVTTKINAKPYILRPWKIERIFEMEQRNIFMLFLVKSACQLHRRREQVRATWGTVEQVNQQKFALVFLVGFLDEACQDNLAQESNEFGDILQANVPDDYQNLPDKVLSGYHWVAREMQDVSDFYVFVDDDCVVNVATVHEYFYKNRKRMIANNSVYCGLKFNDNARPIRANETEHPESNKYVVSEETYSKPTYPSFCHGGMTALTFPLLRDIYSMSEVTQRGDFHLEDVYITGILREKLGRGDANIQPTKSDQNRQRRLISAGSFVWHVGNLRSIDRAFTAVWRSMLKLVTVRVGKYVRKGALPTWRDSVVQLNERGRAYL